MILDILMILNAAVAVAAAVAYLPLRRKASQARKTMWASKGNAIRPAREQFWKADRRQKTAAIVAMVCYVLGVIPAVVLNHFHIVALDKNATAFWTMIVVTLAMIAVGTIALIFNDKDSEDRIKRDFGGE